MNRALPPNLIQLTSWRSNGFSSRVNSRNRQHFWGNAIRSWLFSFVIRQFLTPPHIFPRTPKVLVSPEIQLFTFPKIRNNILGKWVDFQIELGLMKNLSPLFWFSFDWTEPLTNFNEILVPKLFQTPPAFDHLISAEFQPNFTANCYSLSFSVQCCKLNFNHGSSYQ